MWEWNLGVVETAKWIVELVYGMGIYSGARGGFYETLTSARNSRLPVDRPCGTPQAQCDRERAQPPASLTLCSPLRSPCLLRSFSGAVSNTTSPSSRSTHPCTHPPNPSRAHAGMFEPGCAARSNRAARSTGEPAAAAMDCEWIAMDCDWIAMMDWNVR